MIGGRKRNARPFGPRLVDEGMRGEVDANIFVKPLPLDGGLAGVAAQVGLVGCGKQRGNRFDFDPRVGKGRQTQPMTAVNATHNRLHCPRLWSARAKIWVAVSQEFLPQWSWPPHPKLAEHRSRGRISNREVLPHETPRRGL